MSAPARLAHWAEVHLRRQHHKCGGKCEHSQPVGVQQAQVSAWHAMGHPETAHAPGRSARRRGWWWVQAAPAAKVNICCTGVAPHLPAPGMKKPYPCAPNGAAAAPGAASIGSCGCCSRPGASCCCGCCCCGRWALPSCCCGCCCCCSGGGGGCCCCCGSAASAEAAAGSSALAVARGVAAAAVAVVAAVAGGVAPPGTGPGPAGVFCLAACCLSASSCTCTHQQGIRKRSRPPSNALPRAPSTR